MEAAGAARGRGRGRAPEPGWVVGSVAAAAAVERALLRRLSRAVDAWLPVTVGVGWLTTVGGAIPSIAGRWVGSEVGLTMEGAGLAVLEPGQHVFGLLALPIAVLLLARKLRLHLRLRAGPLVQDREILVSTNAAMELWTLEHHPESRGKWNQLAKEIVFPLSIGFVLLGVAMIGSLITELSPEKEFSRKSIGWILANVGLFGWHALVGFFLLPKVILTLWVRS